MSYPPPPLIRPPVIPFLCCVVSISAVFVSSHRNTLINNSNKTTSLILPESSYDHVLLLFSTKCLEGGVCTPKSIFSPSVHIPAHCRMVQLPPGYHLASTTCKALNQTQDKMRWEMIILPSNEYLLQNCFDIDHHRLPKLPISVSTFLSLFRDSSCLPRSNIKQILYFFKCKTILPSH